MQIDLWACVWSGHAHGIHLLIRSTKAVTVLYVHNKHRCLSWRPPFVIMLYAAFLSNQSLAFHWFSLHNLWRASLAAKFNFKRMKAETFSLCTIFFGFQKEVYFCWSHSNYDAMETGAYIKYQSLVPHIQFASNAKRNWAFGSFHSGTAASSSLMISHKEQTSVTASVR